MFEDWKEDYRFFSEGVVFRKPLCRAAHTIVAYMMIILADVNGREPIINCWSKILDWMYKVAIDFLSLLDEIILYGHHIVLSENDQKFVNGFVSAFEDAIYAAASMGLFNDDEED